MDEPDRGGQHTHHGGDAAARTTVTRSRSIGGCPSIATGERRGALSLSEPDAGSDTRTSPAGPSATVTSMCVNGTKAWVTNGERAGVVALAARTDEGISAFIVEKEPGPQFEGISVSRTSASSATRVSRRSR